MNNLAALLLFLFISHYRIVCNVNSEAMAQISVDELWELLTSNYSRLERPNFKGDPVTVEISMYIMDIPKVDTKTMSFEMDFYFRMRWHDDRLRYEIFADLEYFDVPYKKEIWVPDLFFVNAQVVNNPNSNFLMRLYRDGHVLYSTRYVIRARSIMNFKNFPTDENIIKLEVESYAHTANEIIIKWQSKQSLGVTSDQIAGLVIKNVTTRETVAHLTTGIYSRLHAEITLKRNGRLYIMSTYLPLIAVVLMSWLSFWINPKLIILRLGLLVTLLLLATICVLGLDTELPKLAYATSLSNWIALHFVFLSAALIEFILIHMIWGRRSIQYLQEHEIEDKVEGEIESTWQKFRLCLCGISSRLDLVSRVLFPAFYIIFNIIYWAV